MNGKVGKGRRLRISLDAVCDPHRHARQWIRALRVGGGKDHPLFRPLTFPELPKNQHVTDAARWVHAAVGQWLVYALILLHLGATAWHAAIRRDGLLDRMLPEQTP